MRWTFPRKARWEPGIPARPLGFFSRVLVSAGLASLIGAYLFLYVTPPYSRSRQDSSAHRLRTSRRSLLPGACRYRVAAASGTPSVDAEREEGCGPLPTENPSSNSPKSPGTVASACL